MFSIRQAAPDDIRTLVEFVNSAQHNWPDRAFFDRSVAAGNCFVVEDPRQVVGYGVLEYTFYEQGFVPILWLRADFRRQGAGVMMMRHFESICTTPKLFTSTNLSNLPMQSLLAILNYTMSGIIQNLDPGDPELVYVKFLKNGAG